MFKFTSKRERRLWASAAIAVATIYATLGLAKTLSTYLIDRELIDGIFAFGMLLIGVAMAAFALKTKPSGIEIGVAIGIIAIYLLVFARMALPEERSHLIEYSVVALLIYSALKERQYNGRTVPFPPLWAICATSFFGGVDEIIQAFLPNRTFDYRDIIFNCLAGVMAIGGMLALEKVKNWW